MPIDKIIPQRGQPRQHFDSDKLDELASSLREHGLLDRWWCEGARVTTTSS